MFPLGSTNAFLSVCDIMTILKATLLFDLLFLFHKKHLINHCHCPLLVIDLPNIPICHQQLVRHRSNPEVVEFWYVFELFYVLLLSLSHSHEESDLLWQGWLVGRMLGPILRRMSSKRSLEHIDDERAEKVAFIKNIWVGARNTFLKKREMILVVVRTCLSSSFDREWEQRTAFSPSLNQSVIMAYF